MAKTTINNGKNAEANKLISLPKKTLDELEKMAKQQRMTTKPFIEKILIDYVKKNQAHDI